MITSFKKIYRYTEIYKNIEYSPIPEFVAVLGEEPVEYIYNDDLCVDKGDRACYLEDEEVIVNVMRDYELMEIYKDGVLFCEKEYDGSHDVLLSNLEYGDYKARIIYKEEIVNSVNPPKMNNRSGYSGTFSDYTYWKVVNMEVAADKANSRIYFYSANATPIYVRFCDIHGVGDSLCSFKRPILTEEEKRQGFIEVLPDEIQQNFPYIRVYFQTDYGRVINTPIDWFE